MLHIEPSTLLANLTNPAVLAALRLSMVTGTVAALTVVVLGTPLAMLLARRHFRGSRGVRDWWTCP